MSASTLPSPGTKFGPCEPEEKCSHRDCAELRNMAEATCHYCGLSIGWDRRFYSDATGELMHADCLEDELGRR